MVDKQKLVEQLRKLKKQLQNDPQVRALYDTDGDGNISGEEWEKARKSVIAFMKATDSQEKNAGKEKAGGKLSSAAGAAGIAIAGAAGAADHVFNRIKGEMGEFTDAPAGTLLSEPKVIVKQQVEGLELMTDFEGRNRYKLYNEKGKELANAEEAHTGIVGTISRNIFTSRRPFKMGISIYNTPEVVWLDRRFEFIFSRIDVSDDDIPIGVIQQKFSLLNRKYSLDADAEDRELTVLGPLFKPWTFNVMSGSQQVGTIKKKWSGLLKEAFTRADTFTVSFEDPELTPTERKLILATAIAIDIDYFEQSQK